ncbi:MAG: ribosome maturation factor RimP [Endomicrobiia bacterium]
MSKNEIIEKVKEVISPVLESGGYELVDIEYDLSQEGRVLRIYIDKDGGVKIKDCETVTAMVLTVLDTHKIIEEDYFIEVSSPGIYRELKKEKDFLRYIGHRIKVKLYNSMELPQFGKQKVFFGKLKDFKNNTLWIVLDNNLEICFDMSIVAKVNLEPDISILFDK